MILAGCATFSVHYATSPGPYVAEVALGREAALDGLVRALTAKGLQVTTDRASGLITLPNVMLGSQYFDCNYLVRDGTPAYQVMAAVVTMQFLVESTAAGSVIRVTSQFGVVRILRPSGSEHLGRETCYSTHAFEEGIVSEIKLSLTR